jgi:hypothetical protein
MSEQPKREWRIEAGVTGYVSRVYLNGEDFPVRSAKLEVGVGAVTTLTLELVPRRVEIVADPELHIVVGEHRFRVVQETSGALDDSLFRERRDTPEGL